VKSNFLRWVGLDLKVCVLKIYLNHGC
jgi:hypothetical protein